MMKRLQQIGIVSIKSLQMVFECIIRLFGIEMLDLLDAPPQFDAPAYRGPGGANIV